MKVSVIIPCFNNEGYIEDCIKSVENQTYQQIEIICVDDGSSDNTVSVLKELSKKSLLPFSIIEQKNSGASFARNTGLKVASGDYIQFLDSDDLLTPEKIEHQIKIAESNNYPDFIVGSYKRIDFGGGYLNERIYKTQDSNNIWISLMKTNLGNTCSNLFNANLFKNGISWNVNLKSSQESDLMFQILQKEENIAFDPDINTIIRVRESGSISTSNLDKKWERYVQLRVDIIQFLLDKKPGLVSNIVYQVLFDSIRMLYPHDSLKAIQFYNKFIPKEFIPSISNATSSSYINLYKILGFNFTEKIKALISNRKSS